jgi:hypothetical protein
MASIKNCTGHGHRALGVFCSCRAGGIGAEFTHIPVVRTALDREDRAAYALEGLTVED